MKRLYLVRHAKSSWKEPSLSDKERPLNKRGKRDAPFMARLLREQDVQPDVIVSSPAKRASTTAKIFAKELGYTKKKILTDESAYLGGSSALLEIIRHLDPQVETGMLFGHNPDITMLAEQLSNHQIDNIPTCGIVCIEFDADSWRDVSNNNGRFVSFDYPKKHLEEPD